jgi:hypothetical protein
MNRILPNANLPIVHVDNEDQLNEAVSILKQSPVLALDTEFDVCTTRMAIKENNGTIIQTIMLYKLKQLSYLPVHFFYIGK